MEYAIEADVVAEELGAIVSPDYTSRDLTPPGKYASESRKITQLPGNPRVVTLKPEVVAHGRLANPVVKVYWFSVELLGGIIDRATGRKFYRPDRAWFSTEPKRDRVYGKRDEFYPGLTSDVIGYLKAAGYPMQALRNLSGIDAVLSILDESQDRPVGVQTGLEPRGKDTGTVKTNGKKFYRTPGNPAIDVYEGKRVYTKAFSDGNGGWLRSITVDSEEWEAGERVERFIKLTA